MVETKIKHKGTLTPLFKSDSGEFYVELSERHVGHRFNLGDIQQKDSSNLVPAFDENGNWNPVPIYFEDEEPKNY